MLAAYGTSGAGDRGGPRPYPPFPVASA
jgi:hypothetical protein